MDIKALLAKLRKSETLTAEEQAFVDAYDPDKAAADKAAAARRDAEKKLRDKEAELKALQDSIEAERIAAEEKAGASKPEIDQLKAQLAKLTKSDTDRAAAYAKLETEKRALLRGSKVDKLLAGFRFVECDAKVPRLILESTMAALKDEDLDNDELVKPILETFKAQAKPLLLDETPGGSGLPPRTRDAGASNGKPIDKMTADERAADMKKRGIL